MKNNNDGVRAPNLSNMGPAVPDRAHRQQNVPDYYQRPGAPTRSTGPYGAGANGSMRGSAGAGYAQPRNKAANHARPNSGQPNRSRQGSAVRTYAQNSPRNASTTMRPNPNQRKRKHKRKLTAKKVLGRIGLVLLALCIVSAVLIYFYKEHLLNQINKIQDSTNPMMTDESGSIVSIPAASTDTSTIAMPSVAGVHNILLIGIDSRSTSYSKDGTGNLADIIMILTVNENDSSIKLTSVQRDSYVYIPGYTDPQKINAAMTYGGPQLLIEVLESHLRIDLEQYAFVDINHMERVIDAVGGVTVNLSEAERTNPEGGLNELIAEQNVAFGDPVDSHKLYETGTLTLDGRQAVAYARIRHVGNGDYERSQRQVEVLQSLLTRYMNLGLTGKASVLDEVLSQISTNMTESDIEKYALKILLKLTSAKFQYLQVPIEGYSNEGLYYDFKSKGEWSIRPNWNGMIPLVQQFIFEQTFAFEPVAVIPEAPTATPTPTPQPGAESASTAD